MALSSLWVDDGWVNEGWVQTGVTIDWVTGVIFVPKSESTLVQTLPTEIRELNAMVFKNILGALNASPNGRPWTKIFTHNTDEEIEGVFLADLFKIIEPYTVTFEDGLYGVNIVGANTNIRSRTNRNQVSIGTSNSAGLISTATDVDTIAPTWDTTTGIINAYQNGSLINITWGSASDANEVRYNIYISKFNVDVFNSANLLTASQGHFLALGNDTSEPLQDATTYYIGVRAIDIAGNETENTNYATIAYSAVSQTTGLTQEEHDALILTKYQNKAVYLDPDALVNGDGSATSPFDNPNDAKDFAEANGINTVYIYSDTIIPGNVKNFTVIGIGNPVVECNGQDLKNTEFFGCELRGTYTDKIKASKCILGNNFELNGGFQNCSIMNNLTAIDGGAFTLYKCFSNIINNGVTNLSFNGLGSSIGTVVDFDGDINISDVNNANDLLKLSMETNKVTLEATCTLGNIVLSGNPLITNNANGATVDMTSVTSKQNARELLDTVIPS